MNLKYTSYYLVLFLLIFSITVQVAYADTCYVRPTSCDISPTCSLGEPPANCQAITVPTGQCAEGGAPGCDVGCCCATNIGQTRRALCSSSNFIEGYSPDCSAVCGANPPTWSLTGYVKDSSSSFLQGAIVTLDGTTTTSSDIHGKYTFNNLPQSGYSINVNFNGCQNSTHITLDSNKEVNVTVNCSSYILSGYVLNAAGSIVSNANVNFVNYGVPYSATTNIVGFYTFSGILQGSTFTIVASSGTCQGHIDISNINSALTNQNITVNCGNSNITGLVKDGSTPLGGARVATTTGVSTMSDFTGTLGHYLLSNIPNGPVMISAQWTGGVAPTVRTCINRTVISNLNGNLNGFDLSMQCCDETTTKTSCTNNQRIVTVSRSGSPGACPLPLNPAPYTESCVQQVACEWNYTGWSQCNIGDIQRTRSVSGKISTPDCNESLDSGPQVLTDVCPTQCGDGYLNTSILLNNGLGEQCDYASTGPLAGTFNVTPTCINMYNGSGQVTTIQSLIPACNQQTCLCIPPPQPPVYPPCIQDSGWVNITNITNVWQQHAFDISWNMSNQTCQSFVDHYSLKICNNRTGVCYDVNNFYGVNSSIDKGLREYIHLSNYTNPSPIVIEENTQYCYQLTVQFNDSVTLQNRTKTTVLCAVSGNEQCMDPHYNQWCIGNNLANCLLNNTLNATQACTVGTSTGYCRQDASSGGTASCYSIGTTDCDMCNGAFGIFSYVDARPYNSAGKTVICPSISSPNPWNDDSSVVYGCYMDFSVKTTIDQSYSCSNVNTCYDYKSQSSCQDDYCQKFGTTGGNSCQWVSYTSGGLGTNIFGEGMCRPRNESQQICNLCTNPAYQRLYPECTKDTCSLFGNCYFSKPDAGAVSCINKADMTCRLYVSAQDCVNSTGLYRNISVDLFNNKVNSDDVVGLDVCKWGKVEIGFSATTPAMTNGHCYRDADVGNNYDCNQTSTLGFNRTLCEKDVIPPTTNINHSISYGMMMNLNGQVFITDNNPWGVSDSNDKQIKTYYYLVEGRDGGTCGNPANIVTTGSQYYDTPVDSAADPICNDATSLGKFCSDNGYSQYSLGRSQGTGCVQWNAHTWEYNDGGSYNAVMCFNSYDSGCPAIYHRPTMLLDTSSSQAYIINVSKFSTMAGQAVNATNSKNHIFTLYYFSEDPARNMEQVKNFSFILDTEPPNVGVGYSMDSYNISKYQWLTNLSVTLTLLNNESSMPVDCSFQLLPPTDSILSYMRFAGQEVHNIPSTMPPYITKINVTGGTLSTMYPGLYDDDYDYNLTCTDAAQNIYSIKNTIHIEGDSRISAPAPKDMTFTNSTGNNPFPGHISINTTSNGTCKYSTVPPIGYDTMNPMVESNGKYHILPVTLITPDESKVYLYYIWCNLTINGESNIIPGDPSDNVFYAIDDLAPKTSLVYSNTGMPYDNTSISKELFLNLNCNDSNPLLKSPAGTSMAFGCNSSEMYYCIPAINGSNSCASPSDYSLYGVNSIHLDYTTGNSTDKSNYGNRPTIFYYSIDNGGNKETPRFSKLNIKNTDLQDPEIQLKAGFGGVDQTVEYPYDSNGPIIVNSSYLGLVINYTGESNISIIYSVKRTSDVLNVPITEDTALNTLAIFKMHRDYFDSGEYLLTINATDDDSNNKISSLTFTMAHPNNSAWLDTPELGIGQTRYYNITVNTTYASTCKYSLTHLACNSYCNYADSSEHAFSSTGGITHVIIGYDGNTASTLYVTCRTTGSLDDSDSSYVTTSFPVGYQGNGPTIENITYVNSPARDNPYANEIIDPSYNAIIIQVATDQNTICSINGTNGNSQLNIYDVMDNEDFSDYTNYGKYSNTHTYFMNYTGRLPFGTTQSVFNYTINCTNYAQQNSAQDINISYNIATKGPVISHTIDNTFVTSKSVNVTCTGYCTPNYSYNILSDMAIPCSGPYANTGTYGTLLIVRNTSKICISGNDILGRTAKDEANVTIRNFDSGTINITSPRFLNDRYVIGQYNTFDLNITTLDNATCRYGLISDMPDFEYYVLPNDYAQLYNAPQLLQFNHTGNTTHQILSLTLQTGNIVDYPADTIPEWIVICNVSNVDPTSTPYISKILRMGWDNTPPAFISLTQIPNPVTDYSDRKSTINIASDDNSMCYVNGTLFSSYRSDPTRNDTSTYSDYQTSHDDKEYYTNPENTYNTDITYNYNISCQNTAGLWNSQIVGIRYHPDSNIIVTGTTPIISNSTSVSIGVNTSIIAECDLVVGGSDKGWMTGRGTKSDNKNLILIPGKYDVNINCRVPTVTSITGSLNYKLIIDTQKPVVNLSGDDRTCSLSALMARIDISDDLGDSNIVGYNYSVYGPGMTTYYGSGTAAHDTITYSGTLVSGTQYHISAWATDMSGKTSDLKTIDIIANNPDNSIPCDATPPTVTISAPIIINNTIAIIDTNCTDPRGVGTNYSSSGCLQTYSYGISNTNNCSGVIYSNSGTYTYVDGVNTSRELILYGGEKTLCIESQDKAGLITYSKQTINLTEISCGDSQIEVKPPISKLGDTTKYDGWNDGTYNSLPNEMCDRTNLNGKTCMNIGSGVSGTLACTNTCQIDDSACTNGVGISLNNPLPFGISSIMPYNVSISTNISATCRYGDLINPTDIAATYAGITSTMITSNQLTHTQSVRGLNAGEYYYMQKYVVCNATSPGYTGLESKRYGLLGIWQGYDASAPIVAVSSTKDSVVDWNDRTLTISARTTDNNGNYVGTVCYMDDGVHQYIMPPGIPSEYSTYDSESDMFVDYSVMYNSPTPKTFTYTANCYDKAGLNSTGTATVNYNPINYITITKTSPESTYGGTTYVRFDTTPIEFTTNILSQCNITDLDGTHRVDADGSLKKTHSAASVHIGYSPINISIKCTAPFAAGITTAGTAKYQFVGNSTGPHDLTLNVSHNSCSLSSIDIVFDQEDVTGTGISYYNYTVDGVNWQTTTNNHITVVGLSLTDNQSYTTQAQAIDNAGFKSNVATTTFIARSPTSYYCDNTAPVMGIQLQNQTSIFSRNINITCSDAHCADNYNYSIINQSDDCLSATYTTRAYIASSSGSKVGTLNIGTNSKLCIVGYDQNGNVGYASANISVVNRNTGTLRVIRPTFLADRYIVGTNSSMQIELQTDVDAACGYIEGVPTSDTLAYSIATNFTSTGSTDHIITINIPLADNWREWYVICRRVDAINESEAYITKVYVIGYDVSAPTITLLTTTNVTDILNTTSTLTIHTDDSTVCYRNGTIINGLNDSNYNDYNPVHIEHIIYPFISTPTTFNYNIVCKNFAQVNSAPVIAKVSYALNTTITIEKVYPTGGNDIYTPTGSTELDVRTNLQSTCSATIGTTTQTMTPQPSSDVYYYYSTILNNLQNSSTVTVSCIRAGSNTATATYNIYANSQNPQGLNIFVPSDSCSLTGANIGFSTTYSQRSIDHYSYLIGGVKDYWTNVPAVSGTTTTTASASLNDGQSYDIVGIAVDSAGFNSSVAHQMFTARDPSGKYCENIPPTITITKLSNSIYYSDMAVSCNDNIANNCRSGFDYSYITGGDCSTAAYNVSEYYGNTLTFDYSGTLCVRGYDFKGNAGYANYTISVVSVDSGKINITYPIFLEDRYIISATKTTNITFTTDMSASCKYIKADVPLSSNNTQVYSAAPSNASTSNGLTHKISGFYISSPAGIWEDWYIVCMKSNVTLESEAYITKVVRIMYDPSAPNIIQLTATPVVDRMNKTSQISISTDRPAVCYVNGASIDGNIASSDSYALTHGIQESYWSITDDNYREFNYSVYCVNRAQLQSALTSVIVKYNISDNLVIQKVAPDGNNRVSYITGNSTILSLKTNLQASCSALLNGAAVTLVASGPSGGEYYYDTNLNNLNSTNTVNVTCIRLGVTQTASYIIYANVKGPSNMNIASGFITCSLSGININFSAVDTGTGISRYVYSVTDIGKGTTDSGFTTSGNITYSPSSGAGLANGDNYRIDAYALDNSNTPSLTSTIVVKATDNTYPSCDNTAPRIVVTPTPTAYLDVYNAQVACTDTQSGCTDTFSYSLIGAGQNCNTTATYSSSGLYSNSLTLTNNGRLCVEGSDKNSNIGYAYADITAVVNDANPINLTTNTTSPQVSLYPDVIVTSNPIVNISLESDINAMCRYVQNTPSSNLTVLYNNAMPLDVTGNKTHIIYNFNTNSAYSTFIYVVCNAPQLSNSQYSMMAIRVVYIPMNTTPNIVATATPQTVFDWNNRASLLKITSDTETVCSVSSVVDKSSNTPYSSGDLSNALTYSINHERQLNWTSTTPSLSIFDYEIICKNLAGTPGNAQLNVTYNITSDIGLTMISPLSQSKRSFTVYVQTAIITSCTMVWNNANLGTMTDDELGLTHFEDVNVTADGSYNTQITCTIPYVGKTATGNYTITVNTTAPVVIPPYCGDGIVTGTELCDGTNLNGWTCARLNPASYIGGTPICKSDCSGFDVSNCDDGAGYCGDNKVEWPNSAGIFEGCDGSVSSALSCQTYNFTSGSLSCSNCQINTSRCVQGNGLLGNGNPVCGNGILESGEQCEGTNYTIPCSLYSNFGYGTAVCNSQCKYDLSGCFANITSPPLYSGGPRCGNNVVEYPEQCDGTSGLSTASCKLLGYTGGTVMCYSNNCTYDTSRCTNSNKCSNGIFDNGTESDKDCGGSCAPCALNKTCFGNSDCVSNKCVSGKCVVDTCKNGVFNNGTETDVDCGGSCQTKCVINKNCQIGTDCASGYCTAGKCTVNPCSNGVLDPGEIDVDCGGSCSLCSVGQKCTGNNDCGSENCVNEICAGPVSQSSGMGDIKLIVLILGIVLTLGGTGYVVYKTFMTDNKRPPSHGGVASQTRTEKPIIADPRMIEKQREAIEKRKETRDEQRKYLLKSLGVSEATGVEEQSRKTPVRTSVNQVKESTESKISDKPSKETSEDYVEIGSVGQKQKKAQGNEDDTFNRLQGISKGNSNQDVFRKLQGMGDDKLVAKISKISSTPEKSIKTVLSSKMSDADAINLFGDIAKEKLQSDVFKEILSDLLKSERLSKENVSHILFEYMDKGLLNRGDVAKISSELKII